MNISDIFNKLACAFMEIEDKEIPRSTLTKLKEYIVNHPEILTYQDEFGNNIGMLAAYNCLEKATQKAFLNQEARNQKNKYGETIQTIALDNDIPVKIDLGMEK